MSPLLFSQLSTEGKEIYKNLPAMRKKIALEMMLAAAWVTNLLSTQEEVKQAMEECKITYNWENE